MIIDPAGLAGDGYAMEFKAMSDTLGIKFGKGLYRKDADFWLYQDNDVYRLARYLVEHLEKVGYVPTKDQEAGL